MHAYIHYKTCILKHLHTAGIYINLIINTHIQNVHTCNTWIYTYIDVYTYRSYIHTIQTRINTHIYTHTYTHHAGIQVIHHQLWKSLKRRSKTTRAQMYIITCIHTKSSKPTRTCSSRNEGNDVNVAISENKLLFAQSGTKDSGRKPKQWCSEASMRQ